MKKIFTKIIALVLVLPLAVGGIVFACTKLSQPATQESTTFSGEIVPSIQENNTSSGEIVPYLQRSEEGIETENQENLPTTIIDNSRITFYYNSKNNLLNELFNKLNMKTFDKDAYNTFIEKGIAPSSIYGAVIGKQEINIKYLKSIGVGIDEIGSWYKDIPFGVKDHFLKDLFSNFDEFNITTYKKLKSFGIADYDMLNEITFDRLNSLRKNDGENDQTILRDRFTELSGFNSNSEVYKRLKILGTTDYDLIYQEIYKKYTVKTLELLGADIKACYKDHPDILQNILNSYNTFNKETYNKLKGYGIKDSDMLGKKIGEKIVTIKDLISVGAVTEIKECYENHHEILEDILSIYNEFNKDTYNKLKSFGISNFDMLGKKIDERIVTIKDLISVGATDDEIKECYENHHEILEGILSVYNKFDKNTYNKLRSFGISNLDMLGQKIGRQTITMKILINDIEIEPTEIKECYEKRHEVLKDIFPLINLNENNYDVLRDMGINASDILGQKIGGNKVTIEDLISVGATDDEIKECYSKHPEILKDILSIYDTFDKETYDILISYGIKDSDMLGKKIGGKTIDNNTLLRLNLD